MTSISQETVLALRHLYTVEIDRTAPVDIFSVGPSVKFIKTLSHICASCTAWSRGRQGQARVTTVCEYLVLSYWYNQYRRGVWEHYAKAVTFRSFRRLQNISEGHIHSVLFNKRAARKNHEMKLQKQQEEWEEGGFEKQGELVLHLMTCDLRRPEPTISI